MKSTIRLFKAVPIEKKQFSIVAFKKEYKETINKILAKTIEYGFVLSPEVIANYSDKNISIIIKEAIEEVGLSAKQMNSSFHKSWQKIKEADMEQLVVEQLAHYLTTYGKEQPTEYLIEKEEQWGVDNLAEKIIGLGDFESDRIKDEDYVYIPKEKLEIPGLEEGIKFIIIKGYTKDELKKKVFALCKTGIAFGEDTIKDIFDVILFVEINEKELELIKNREVKIKLYDFLEVVPEDPVEFLRYLIYKTTGRTLLIKDKATIEAIKSKSELHIVKLFNRYKKAHTLNELGKIFYRYKPLFLAFKSNSELRHTINRIRKLAKRYHEPMKEDYLNGVTALINKGKEIDWDKLEYELGKINVNTFRKIRLAYALNFRAKNTNSILYRIRNGKGYATTFHFRHKRVAKKVLDIVMKSIIEDIKRNVKGKKIYIPENINYTLPSTEKQFTGDMPSGSYVSIPKDMILGVHWENQDHKRIDLDLSMISVQDGKIGWDSRYRSGGGDILFSGDMTNASKPNGASELFYIRKQSVDKALMYVNYYNYEEGDIPFKILVAQEQAKNFKCNYMVNPNNIIAIAKTKINKKQKVLGLLVMNTAGCRFYFTEAYLGDSITSSENVFNKNSREFLFNYYENAINLKDVLEEAGAKLVKTKDKCDIDLSPESLEKDKIIRLIKQ